MLQPRPPGCHFATLHVYLGSDKKGLNSLPHDKILDWSKLKEFADDIIKIHKMMIYVFDRVENIVGEGENAGYQHFLLFPRCFKSFSLNVLKGFLLRVAKSRDCVVKR